MENYLEQVRLPEKNLFLMCYSYALGWVKDKQKFSSEDIIADYEKTGAPIPKEKRVWGAVVRELHKNKLIKHAGFGTYKNPAGHKKPVNVWIAN